MNALNEPSTDAERINTKLKKGKSIAKGSFFAFLINKFMRSTNVVNADDSDTVATPDYSKFTSTDSGLKYFDTKLGEGQGVIPGDTVRVHYTGWLDGFDGEKKFDSSYDRRSPLKFTAGVKQVIR